jgi:hypothetical protein
MLAHNPRRSSTFAARTSLAVVCLSVCLSVSPVAPSTTPSVLTAAYDNQRDGYEANETTLTADHFCASPVAPVTTANGQVFVPTYSIGVVGGADCPTSSASADFDSGLLVYALGS